MQLRNTKLHCNDVCSVMCTQIKASGQYDPWSPSLRSRCCWDFVYRTFLLDYIMRSLAMLKPKQSNLQRCRQQSFMLHSRPKTTLPGCMYTTEPAAAAAYPRHRPASCSGRGAMMSPGSNWLNRQIIGRQKSKQTGKIKLLRVIVLPCLIFGR